MDKENINSGRSATKKKSTEKHSDPAKRCRLTENDVTVSATAKEYITGKVKKISVRNFMCHEALEITLNENVNFIVGRNGSGKSAILTALTIGLGARANVTNRGTSVKEFIKKGKTSATIEITLLNKGEMAYKYEIYGDVITVIRIIGTTSSYKIKNWRGEIISTKRDELDNIIASMNIQIDNPISVLNQDVSRTFLVSSKPEEKYNLFTKATLLNIIESNYIEALQICQEEYKRLKGYSEALSQVKTDIQKLKESIHRLEEIDSSRAELNNLEMELHWAKAIVEETKLQRIQETLNMYENSLKELQNVKLSAGTKDEEINSTISEVKQKIQQAEQEVVDSSEAYNSAKQKYSAANEAYSNKQREWRSVTSKIKRLEDDIDLLEKEIQKLENDNDEEHKKKKEIVERLSKLEERLNELKTSLRTKQTELTHLEANKMRLSQELQSAKNEVESSDASIYKIKRKLSAFEQQSDNALSVFGSNIPRLLRRIEEEHKKGRFKEKPRGPIGAYMKMKDAAWAPAVESFLGFGTLSTFCVDNSKDANLLNSIMKEIFYNERPPQIVASKFYNQVHDVKHYCTQSPRYSNLFEAMVIEDPVVANCLIDQREVECVLLIPTNEEACEIMSTEARVPKNCKRAFTQQGDIFYPDPNYRSYGGKCSKRAKYLQVSTMEAIQTLKEELQLAEIKKQEAVAMYNAVHEKMKRTNSELNNVNAAVSKLITMQNECQMSVDNLKDKVELNEATSADVFRNEAAELEKRLVQERAMEKLLAENVQELQSNFESLNVEVKRCRDLKYNLHTVIDPLKDQVKELMHEKERHRIESQRATRKLQGVHQAVQCATGEYEIQERATKKAVSNATQKCSRIDTTRSVNEIKTLLNDLWEKIREVEHQFGSINDLHQQLQEKEEKFGKNITLTSKLKQSCEKHIKRVEDRQKIFTELRDLYSVYIQKSFTDVLALRKYKGTIEINHASKVLNLHVSARNDKNTGNTRSLSGGERSYSTVAFILALWECVQLPFYFLDEFDVFMDKVNRRVIMDILLEHAKSHPESQFTFLTPLDTSHILPEDYVTIHQLQPPERRGLSQ